MSSTATRGSSAGGGRVAVGLLAVGLSLAAYAGCLAGTRVFDDFHSVFENPGLREWRDIPRFFFDRTLFSAYGHRGSYRPVTLTSYTLTFSFFGDSDRAFHAGNLLLHLTVVAVVFCLFLTLCEAGGIPRPRLAAGVGAAIFGVHPAASQVVHYISSRSESLALLGLMIAATTHVACLRTPDRFVRRGLICGATAAAVAFALGAKETGVLAVLVLPAVHVAAARGDTGVRWKRVLWLTPAFLLVGLYARALLLGGGGAIAEATAAAPSRGSDWIPDALRANWVYWQIAFWPAELAVFRELPLSSWPEVAAISAAVVLLLGCGVSLVALSRERLCLWGLAGILFFGPLLPYLFRPLHLTVNENRIYPPLVGLALASGLAVELVFRRLGRGRARGALVIVLSVVFLASAIRDWRVSRIWVSEILLWENAVRISPWSGDIRAGLGIAYMGQERWDDAERELRAALELSSWQPFVILDNLGIVAHQKGDDKEALRYFREAYALHPGSVEVTTNLGGVLLELGEPAQSLPYFHQAISQVPGYCSAHLGLMRALLDLGRPQECRERRRELPVHCQDDVRLAELQGCEAIQAN